MKKIKLGDVANFKNGVNFSNNDSTITYKCVGVKNFQRKILDDFDDVSTISIDRELPEEYFLRDNDILLVRSNGNKQLIGRSMLVFPKESVVTYSGFCIRCRISDDSVDTRYIFYCLQNALRLGLFAINQQTNINNINQTALSNLPIDLPPGETQDKIAALLGALDDKITLNKKINATLEVMAKTLYDYWFVQFDFPDEHDKPYKTSGGKMIYSSDLGRDVPDGWEVRTLENFGALKNGINYDKNTIGDCRVKIVNVKDISNSTFSIATESLDNINLPEEQTRKYSTTTKDIFVETC